jgi:hypothetical protein
MSDLSLNNKSYELASTGPIKAKEIKSVDEIKNDLNDDIVVKTKENKLIAISADELDIKSKSFLTPYVGLPNIGDKISLFADNKKIEGTVAYSENENDSLTNTIKVIEKRNDEIKVTLNELSEENKKTIARTPQKDFKQKEPDFGAKTIEKTKEAITYVEEQISPPTPEEKVVKDVKKAVNNVTNETAKAVTGLVEEVTGQKLTVGQMDTFAKGNVDLSVDLSKNPTFNAYYTVDVTKLDEELYPTGNGLFNEPVSEIYFLAHSVGTHVGPHEVSVGYKGNIGVEFNRPLKNDLSFSAALMVDAGIRPGDNDMFLGLGVGLEARYQVDKNVSIFGGPVARGTLIGDPGKGKGAGLEAGVNLKF